MRRRHRWFVLPEPAARMFPAPLGQHGGMPKKKLSRAALGMMLVQQAVKFAQSPQGQQMIARAKQAANDPKNRQKVADTVNRFTPRRPARSPR
jgi:hypothetical protein